jgi:GNAT superfamily N-acetyltransferase
MLRKLIEVSVRGLQARDYSPSQIESALATVYGVDSQLIADGTYFVVEVAIAADQAVQAISHRSELLIVGCGGWSRRKTLFGADHWTDREDSLLSPEQDAAKIRAFFVHPDWARRGIGSMILVACERGCGRCRFHAPRNGGHAQRTAILSGSRIHRFGGARCSLSKRRIAPHHSHEEARLSYCS